MNFRAALTVCVLGLAAAAIAGSAALVFAAAAAILLLAFVRYARLHVFDRLEYSRALSRKVSAWGGEIELTTTIANRKWLPVIWLRVADQWPVSVEPLRTVMRRTYKATYRLEQALTVRWYERVRRHYVGRCTERGIYRFGPAQMEASDPFGMTAVIEELTDSEQLMVLPKVLAVPQLDLLVGRPLVGAPARRALARDPASFIGVRRYQSGDPLRAVNWRATARASALQVNEWEPTTTAAVKLLLNTRVHEYVHQGSGIDEIELLLVVAASLSVELARLGWAVGLASNAYLSGQWGAIDIEPSNGGETEILETLARVIALPPSTMNEVMRRELASDDGATEYFVITAGLHGGLTPQLARLREQAPTHAVYVGDVPEPARALIDWRIPADFDWREQNDLPLA
jgi:uncharacterized protein (DUF58 family)